jgi:hypothetical protein
LVVDYKWIYLAKPLKNRVVTPECNMAYQLMKEKYFFMKGDYYYSVVAKVSLLSIWSTGSISVK